MTRTPTKSTRIPYKAMLHRIMTWNLRKASWNHNTTWSGWLKPYAAIPIVKGTMGRWVQLPPSAPFLRQPRQLPIPFRYERWRVSRRPKHSSRDSYSCMRGKPVVPQFSAHATCRGYKCSMKRNKLSFELCLAVARQSNRGLRLHPEDEESVLLSRDQALPISREKNYVEAGS